MKSVHRILRIPLALVIASAAVLFGQSPAQAAPPPQSVNGWLQVWNYNTARMSTGPDTDWRQFIYYITDAGRVSYRPDIVTVQEVGTDYLNLPGCENIANLLQSRTGEDYHCYETNDTGGSSIVYRTGRLSKVGEATIPLKYREFESETDCKNSTWTAQALRLSDDKVAGKYVNVASVHLPYNGNAQDADCAWDNSKIISSALANLGSSQMQIMGGDWNHVDAAVSGTSVNWECWYEGTTTTAGGALGNCGGSNLGWKDPQYRKCDETNDGAYNIWKCMDNVHRTHGGTRIDFLLAKAHTASGSGTVDYYQAWQAAGSPGGPQKYSDHRGQGAALKYY
ncbi:endonuclease/exonuclease/phosphatase family protein [Catelliglobosispora koreensis]|uniref:endonuclease/exonuclease/phosphatase family protein n=1 Tax=Catelliglobosispora koreensis TaxID=129052 RepID=UPI000382584B|nr:endonuclease/exonuclease/phosphatase family protein [Catelliglobosispora koreensis]